ncbi:MAG TPA: hypothetical protein VFE58_17670 [Tepidisphaeraceae bacterium]|nr:hypothetical protein [Tepidisphaeraceae bacterium]
MKSLVLLSLAVGGLISTGCAKHYTLDNDFGATPAYSSTERYQQIYRAWDYEGRQAMDDIDSALLLRPAGHLTVWNVQ